MVVALKELSIRGDFQTTVQYLVKLMETDSFQSNSFHTGWLDKLIADRVQVMYNLSDGRKYTKIVQKEVPGLKYISTNKL